MKYIILFILSLLTACDKTNMESNRSNVKDNNKESTAIASTGYARWYNPSLVKLGEGVYRSHCLACHKQNAVGVLNWKKTLPNGDYPPPPLNGSAHAWHHDLEELIHTIKFGGASYGGVMPAFAKQLSSQEIRACIAYFQSFWDDEIYYLWLEMGGLE